MMLAESAPDKVYLCREPVDFRQSIDGLAALVEGVLAHNPFSGHWFVFTNRRRDKVKILYWARNGFCLWYKRLEQQRFKWPHHRDGQPITLSPDELRWLLDGVDLSRLKAHRPLHYSTLL